MSTFYTAVQFEDFVCCVVPTELVCVHTLSGIVFCDTVCLGVNKVHLSGEAHS